MTGESSNVIERDDANLCAEDASKYIKRSK